MEADLSKHLRVLAERYMKARRLEPSTLGQRAAGDWRFFERLGHPERTFTIRKYDEVVQWFANEWPPEVEWPDGVHRPKQAPVIRRRRSARPETAEAAFP